MTSNSLDVQDNRTMRYAFSFKSSISPWLKNISVQIFFITVKHDNPLKRTYKAEVLG